MVLTVCVKAISEAITIGRAGSIDRSSKKSGRHRGRRIERGGS